MLWPGPQQSVFWYDFEGLTDGNLWADKGPNGLHATPQAGFASPNFGLARNAHNKGYANFTGAANVYGTLPLRFYNYAPVIGNMTLVVVAQHTIPTINCRIFNARTGAEGMFCYYVTAETMNILAYDAGGVGTQLFDAANVPLTGRTRASIYALGKTGSTGYIWHDCVQRTVTWGGNTNPIAYNLALVPSIGSAGAASYFIGRMYWLILFPFVFTDSEAKAMSAWLMDQV